MVTLSIDAEAGKLLKSVLFQLSVWRKIKLITCSTATILKSRYLYAEYTDILHALLLMSQDNGSLKHLRI